MPKWKSKVASYVALLPQRLAPSVNGVLQAICGGGLPETRGCLQNSHRESDGCRCCKLPSPLQSGPGKERASERLSALGSCTETSVCCITGAMLKGENENDVEPCLFEQSLLNFLKRR